MNVADSCIERTPLIWVAGAKFYWQRLSALMITMITELLYVRNSLHVGLPLDRLCHCHSLILGSAQGAGVMSVTKAISIMTNMNKTCCV